MPHTCLFLTFDYFFLNLFVHIVDSLTQDCMQDDPRVYINLCLNTFHFQACSPFLPSPQPLCFLPGPSDAPQKCLASLRGGMGTRNSASGLSCITCSRKVMQRREEGAPRKCVPKEIILVKSRTKVLLRVSWSTYRPLREHTVHKENQRQEEVP